MVECLYIILIEDPLKYAKWTAASNSDSNSHWGLSRSGFLDNVVARQFDVRGFGGSNLGIVRHIADSFCRTPTKISQPWGKAIVHGGSLMTDLVVKTL